MWAEIKKLWNHVLVKSILRLFTTDENDGVYFSRKIMF